MYPTWALHNVVFPKLEELLKLESGESIWESADFLWEDHPCNVRCSPGDKNLGHKRLSVNDMEDMVPLWGAVLKSGGQGYLSPRFCEMLKFGKWYWNRGWECRGKECRVSWTTTGTGRSR